MRFKLQSWLACVVVLCSLTSNAQQISESIIPKSRRVDWIPGVTVGVSAGVSKNRTKLIDVTQAPYSADKTGVSSASAAIQAAINAAQSNDVVYLPAGKYRISTGLTLDKSYITLRPDGPTNTVLLGITASSAVLRVGHDGLQTSQAGRFDVVGGATKGSTNVTLASNVSHFGNSIRPGDMLTISTETRQLGSSTFPIISVANFDRIINQTIVVTSVSGNSVTLSHPLVWDMSVKATLSEVSPSWFVQPQRGVGIENLGITLKYGTESGSAGFMIMAGSLQDCWFDNLDLAFASNYQVYITGAVGCEISHCAIHDALSSGSSHAGLLISGATGCLVQDNIFSNDLFPAIEFNSGTMGCAFAYNYFTNTSLAIDCHNTHPMMNLWEGNAGVNNFKMDGYFGSASHQTLYRNQIDGVGFKRWTSNMQVVGNVLGKSSSGQVYSREEANYGAPWPIFEFGFPNIGNSGYEGTSPPISWNFPGKSVLPFTAPYSPIPNGIYTFTADQGPTNVLWGNFTNVPSPLASGYPILFQDGADTNKYYGAPDGGVLLSTAAGTSSNLMLNVPVSVKKGWTLFIAVQNAYQQRQANDQLTHILHGNRVYTNFTGVVLWSSSISDHSLPPSLLYAQAPSWWGTNRWPAIDPEAAVTVAAIPAQNRYHAIPNGTGQPQPSKPAPPSSAPRVL